MENILIIDNNPFFQTEIKALLLTPERRIYTAKTGQEAFNATKIVDIDLAVVEFALPDTDGLSVMSLLRKLKPEIPVIIMTTSRSLELAMKVLTQGADGFLVKPIKPQELNQLVERLLARQRFYLEKSRTGPDEEVQRLIQQLESQIEELTILNKLTATINSSLDVDSLCEKIVGLLGEILNVEMVSLMLLDKTGQNLFIQAAIGLPAEVKRKTRRKVTDGIAGWVLQNKQPLLISDMEKDSRFKPSSWYSQYRNASFVSVPLIARTRPLGVLNVSSKLSGAPFTVRDLNFITSFAVQASFALEGAILYASLEKEMKRFSLIAQANNLFTETTDLKKVMVLIIQKVQELLNIKAVSLLLLDERRQELKFAVALGEYAHTFKDMRIKLGEGIAGWVAKEGKTLLIKDTSEDARFASQFDKETPSKSQSVLCVPLKLQNKVLGVIQVVHKRDQSPFNAEDQRMLEALSSGAAIALRNAKLFKALREQTQKFSGHAKEREIIV